jgi:hypothetical protein
MSRSSQALVVYDPRMLNPPSSFLFMKMMNDVINYEKRLMQSQHPHQTHDIVVELRSMFFTMQYIDDWSLLKRVITLLKRARVKMVLGCHEFMHRCAVLVDECSIHQHSLLCRKNKTGSESNVSASIKPSYDSLALALALCDDVLPYLVPSMKQFYIYDLRRSMVAHMQDSESDSSDRESDDNNDASPPAAKRVCSTP